MRRLSSCSEWGSTCHKLGRSWYLKEMRKLPLQHVSRAARPQRTMRNLSALGPKQEHMLLDLNEGPWQKALLRGTGEEDNRPRSDVIEASLFLVSMPGTLEPWELRTGVLSVVCWTLYKREGMFEFQWQQLFSIAFFFKSLFALLRIVFWTKPRTQEAYWQKTSINENNILWLCSGRKNGRDHEGGVFEPLHCKTFQWIITDKNMTILFHSFVLLHSHFYKPYRSLYHCIQHFLIVFPIFSNSWG